MLRKNKKVINFSTSTEIRNTGTKPNLQPTYHSLTAVLKYKATLKNKFYNYAFDSRRAP